MMFDWVVLKLKYQRMRQMKFTLVGLIAFSILASSCKNMNRSQKGAVIGATGGGAIGAVIGKATGNTALGAILGATVGGVTGAVIGRKMDKQAEEIKNEVTEFLHAMLKISRDAQSEIIKRAAQEKPPV